MARKFIIEDNQFKLGHVGYHRELASDTTKVIGGGYWTIKNDKLYLYSSSQDFGTVSIEQVRDVKNNGNVEEGLLKFPWIFSSKHEFFEAEKTGIEV